MKLAILGSGNVGAALGKGWAARGHEIRYGVRDPRATKVADVVAATGGQARAATPKEAVAGVDAVVLAVPFGAARDALQAAGDLAGRILIDPTNPLKPDLSGLTVGYGDSAGEQVARWAPRARVVKTLNTIGHEHMSGARRGDTNPTMFLCGDDAGAKQAVSRLLEELGFEAVDAGPLRQSRLLEPLAMLWITLAYSRGMGSSIAFKLLRR